MERPLPRTLAADGLAVHVLPGTEAGRRVAARIAEAVRRGRGTGGGAVLGLATGRTPLAVYDELARLVAAGELSLAGVTTFNLDEYVGLGPEHPASFAAYMRRHLVERTDVDPARVHLPLGDAADPEAEAKRYEQALRAAGGIDLQLLGVGRNGHIAFNEPGSGAETRTRVVRLAPETRAANAADFPPGEAVPERAITMGIGTILEARRIVVLATGAAKREAVRRMLTGPIGPDTPASFLRRHPACEVWLDEEAAAGLAG